MEKRAKAAERKNRGVIYDDPFCQTPITRKSIARGKAAMPILKVMGVWTVFICSYLVG